MRTSLITKCLCDDDIMAMSKQLFTLSQFDYFGHYGVRLNTISYTYLFEEQMRKLDVNDMMFREICVRKIYFM